MKRIWCLFVCVSVLSLTLGCSRNKISVPTGLKAANVGNSVSGVSCSSPLEASLQMVTASSTVRVGESVRWTIRAQGGCGEGYKVSTSAGAQQFSGTFEYAKTYTVPMLGARESVYVAAVDASGAEIGTVRADSAVFDIVASVAPAPTAAPETVVVIGVPVVYPPVAAPPACTLEIAQQADLSMKVSLRLEGSIARAFVNGLEVRPLPVPPANTADLIFSPDDLGPSIHAVVYGPDARTASCTVAFAPPPPHPAIAACLGGWPRNIPFTFRQLAEPRVMNMDFINNSSTVRTDSTRAVPELIVVNVNFDRGSSNQLHLQDTNAWYCLNIRAAGTSSNQLSYPCNGKTSIGSHVESGSSSNRIYCQ